MCESVVALAGSGERSRAEISASIRAAVTQRRHQDSPDQRPVARLEHAIQRMAVVLVGHAVERRPGIDHRGKQARRRHAHGKAGLGRLPAIGG